MRIGVAEIDITPDFEVELSGYAARQQPSLGVLDRIFVRAMYLEDSGTRLLWLAADVIAFSSPLVESFRGWANDELHLQPSQVLLSATHTHAAPATISLTGCGRCSDGFIDLLQDSMRTAARQAAARSEGCRVKCVQRELKLAIDRRGMPSAHVDPLATALGLVREDGTFIAACLNYAMHPVALSHDNRHISADWCGYAASALANALPGKPVVLVSNGACGNINPPLQTTRASQVQALGEQVAASVASPLRDAPAADATLQANFERVDLPLEPLSSEQADAIADAARGMGSQHPTWQHALNAAVDAWRETVRQAPANPVVSIDLLAARIGPIVMLAVNGEMFSRFTAMVREKSKLPLFVVAYANAAFGYIPTREAYAEGGYEVERAHLFYNSLRPRIGGLEMLADRAAEMLKTISTTDERR